MKIENVLNRDSLQKEYNKKFDIGNMEDTLLPNEEAFALMVIKIIEDIISMKGGDN